MTETPALRHADITDRMIDLESGGSVRVSGFYKITEREASPYLGGGQVRLLTRCLADDPLMEVIGTTAACGLFHRPWRLRWNGPIPWDAIHIAEYRSQWRESVEEGDDIHTLGSRSYPELFERFPPLTNHERLLLAGWQRETDTHIRAYEVRAREATLA